jgi:ribosomal protein S18 acetylase RimI-like enzyme
MCSVAAEIGPERAVGDDSGAAVIVRGLADHEVASVSEVLGLSRLNQGDGRYLVAWLGTVPVGHVHLTNDDPPEMQDLEVRPEYQQRGMATALIAGAEREARGRHAAKIRLEVSEANTPARRLYQRNGYTLAAHEPRRVDGIVHIRTGPIEVHDVLLSMEKTLDRDPPG